MTLAATFIEAEHAAGKTTPKILDDLNAATGYNADGVSLYRWRVGERNPSPEVRRYMLRKAIPYLAKSWELGLGRAQVNEIAEKLL
jgi:hypothetical protein